jgi:hypothetical protein
LFKTRKKSMKKYDTHPAADLFPPMTEKELQGLIQDIKDNGQREPATFWCGKLIDGRNRATACERLNISLSSCEIDPATDPVGFVISHNLQRRHLTPSQRSMVAAKHKKLLEPAAKERQRAAGGDKAKALPAILPEALKGDSRDVAAAAAGVSGRLVDAAEKVIEKGTPELQASVANGQLSVSRAAKIADAPKNKQAALVTKPRKAREKKAHSPAVDDGSEPIADALGKAVPDSLVTVFKQLPVWKQAMHKVSEAKEALTKIKEQGAAAMHLDVAETERLLDQARINFKFAMPHTECVKCRRRPEASCKHCRGQGWLNEATLNACVSDADKSWLEARE